MKAPTRFIDIDFETKSVADITKVGTVPYAQHPTTRILMISFSLNEKDIVNFNPYFPSSKIKRMLRKAIKLVKNGNAVLRAFNSEFEFHIWNEVGTKQFGWPAIEVHEMFDAMVMSCVAGFPAKLETAAIAARLTDKKDTEGTKLINFFSKPIPNTNGRFRDPKEHKDRFFKFIKYCDQDVRTQIALAHASPPLTARHWRVYQLTERMNARGLPVDLDMAKGAIELAEAYAKESKAEIVKLTNGKINSATQTAALKKWLNSIGCDIPNLQAPVVEKYINSTKTNNKARDVLKLRANSSKTSIAKYTAALIYAARNDVVHSFLKAFIAITGRWGGRGMQIQNFSKPSPTFPKWADYDVLAQAITDADIVFINAIYGEVMEALKAATRAVIKAPAGKKFVSADYSQIEARIVMWLAGDLVGLTDFAGEGLIYENMAGTVFGIPAYKILKPSFERDVGKEVVLGCGFGMGAAKFVFRCVEQRNLDVTLDLGKRAVKEYRRRYKEVPKAWADCEKAAIQAIENPGEAFFACKDKLCYWMQDHFLTCTLPSGRKLYYPEATIKTVSSDYGPRAQVHYRSWVDKMPAGRKWTWNTIWGGTFFQHAVQGTAMDIMADGMENAEKHGYDSLFTVHDEAVSLVDQYFGGYKEYEQLLCQTKPWAKGLPVVSEGWEGTRYRK